MKASTSSDSAVANCNRRDFLKLAGAGSAGLAVSTILPPTALLARENPNDGIWRHHVVPVDKDLPIGWIRSLYARGEKEVWRGAELKTVGLPIGGIAAGQLYLCGDGTLGNWEIFNEHRGSGCGHTSYARRSIEKEVAHGFAVFGEADGKGLFVPLSAEGFADVRFRGEHPIGLVSYADEAQPVRVQLEAFSPFIPLDAKDSALPATMFHVTVENVSGKPVKAGIATWLENPVARKAAAKGKKGKRATRYSASGGRAMLVHSVVPAPPEKPAADERPAIVVEDFESGTYGKWKVEGEAFGAAPASGALARQSTVTGFEGSKLANSFFKGDDTLGTIVSQPFRIERKYLNFLVGGGNKPGDVGVRLMVDGRGVRGSTGREAETVDWESWDVSELEGKEAVLHVFDDQKGPWGHVLFDHLEMADVPRHSRHDPAEIERFPDFGNLVLCVDGEPMSDGDASRAAQEAAAFAGRDVHRAATEEYPIDEGRAHAFGAKPVTLQPGAKHTFFFALAWYFPNTVWPDHEAGHAYAERFADAAEVAEYVLANRERFAASTRKWRDTYYDSTLPYWLLDRLHLTSDCLATGTTMWWKNGRFWAWEGVVSCHGTCTHVYNYSQSMAHLFPELERNVRERQDFDAGFQEDGLVGFRSDGAYAADGQCGTILKAWREHRMSADDSFLKRNWPSIKKALDYSIGHDGNKDGLIEDLQHNTYDINFFGANTFVGALYLAALRAGEEMAREVGDEGHAKELRRIYESGRKLTEERLWNGEYFVQEVDLAKHPRDQYGQGCLSDQLFGQNWAHLTGLGHLYSPDKIQRTMESIWKYNWTTDVGAYNNVHPTARPFADDAEYGLLTCTWPKSEYLADGMMYKEEVWTGIEYEVAATMIREGFLEEGLAICRGVHDRYHPAKRNPYNEVECGDFYGRAMASWGVLLALCGFAYHGPKGQLAFGPRITPENFKSAFTTAQGWGTFGQRLEDGGGRWEIRMLSGRLRLESLELGALDGRLKKHTVKLMRGGTAVQAKVSADGSSVVAEFAEPLVLQEGDVLEVSAT